MNIGLDSLEYTFKKKPLLVGGMAMEYYNLRKSGEDIDLIVDESDIVELVKIYPNRVKDIWGDLGVCPMNFEIWRTIKLQNYDDLKVGSIDIGEVLVISKEKLLIMKALAMKDKEKYLNDTKLIVEDILNEQFKKYDNESVKNKLLLSDIEVSYIEKLGPVK